MQRAMNRMDRRQNTTHDRPELPIDLRDFYLTLREIASVSESTLNLERLRSTQTHFLDSQLWTRVSLLLDRLGVPESRGLEVAEGFATVIRSAPTPSAVPRSGLESIVRWAHQEESHDSDILARYERKVLNLLRQSDTGWVDDRLDPEISQNRQPQDTEPWIDTKPIVRLWPKDILE